MTTCLECVPCATDHCDNTAYCLSQPGTHPCPHDGAWCEAHNLEGCADCRLEAEMNMYRAGDYDPRSDPFYLPEAKTADDAYWADALSVSDYGADAPASAAGFRYPPAKDDA